MTRGGGVRAQNRPATFSFCFLPQWSWQPLHVTSLQRHKKWLEGRWEDWYQVAVRGDSSKHNRRPLISVWCLRGNRFYWGHSQDSMCVSSMLRHYLLNTCPVPGSVTVRKCWWKFTTSDYYNSQYARCFISIISVFTVLQDYIISCPSELHYIASQLLESTISLNKEGSGS